MLASCVILSGTMLPSSAAAAVISSNYTFDSGALTSTDTDLTSTAGPIGTSKSYFGASSSNNNYFVRSTDGTNVVYSTTVSDAISTDRRFSFTFTPTVAVDLTKLEFTMGGNSGGLRSFTGNIQVRTSLDSNATSVGGTKSHNVPTSGGSTSLTPTSHSIDLTAFPAFKNIASPITFNFFGFFTDYSSVPPATAADAIRIDNIQLTTAPIPEPVSSSLMLAGLAWCARRPRRTVN